MGRKGLIPWTYWIFFVGLVHCQILGPVRHRRECRRGRQASDARMEGWLTKRTAKIRGLDRVDNGIRQTSQRRHEGPA